MLELDDVSLRLGASEEAKKLLEGVTAGFPGGHFVAIIGPSGCGKTTLLKTIAGVAEGHESGSIKWMGRNLADDDFHASEIAYVPQFGTAHEQLTAEECVEFSIALRVADSGRPRAADVARLLEEVGLSEHAAQVVKTLSGGQRRRLALAMDLASHPHLLLCDEVTSGLDPQAEEEIVELFHRLSRREDRLVISVTHSMAQLERYDSVLVMSEGKVVFCGPPEKLNHYFSIERAGQLYERLRQHPSQAWSSAWNDARKQYELEVCSPTYAMEETSATAGGLPHPISQFLTLLRRRFLILSRSPFQILLHLALIIGFPLLVAIFAWGGLPDVKNLEMGLGKELSSAFQEKKEFLEHASEIGSLVSGIIMFQVVLLCLLGANNSGREIASERAIYEKERLSGLSPLAYVASKVGFLSVFVILQSLWMGAFVNLVCDFPGGFLMQFAFLALVNAAITSVCLGISSMSDSAEHASIASIYFVGFQLPLSGAVLALPEAMGPLIRPLISAYWGWSGIVQTLQGERYYDIVQSVAQSPLSSGVASIVVLFLHTLAGLVVAWIGCERHRSI